MRKNNEKISPKGIANEVQKSDRFDVFRAIYCVYSVCCAEAT